MTELDRLPPDQRAVLSLVLDRGKSYTEVAALLGIPEATVRDRAHAALDALADDVATAGGSRVAGAGTSSAGTGTAAASSAGTGTAATSSAGTGTAATSSAGTGTAAARFEGAGGGPGSSAGARRPSATSPVRPRQPRAPHSSAGSRRAGALLLGAILVVIVIAVVIVSSSGGKGSPTATTSAGSTTGTGTSSSSTANTPKPKLDSTIRLSSSEPSVNASGVAYVLSEGSRRAFYVAAQGLPPSNGFFYAVWLYNSPSDAEPLGRASSVSSNGRMEGGNPLPSNAGNYAKFIVTRETSSHPKEPGPTVLSGSFTLH
jgi:hypothetical protein